MSDHRECLSEVQRYPSSNALGEPSRDSYAIDVEVLSGSCLVIRNILSCNTSAERSGSSIKCGLGLGLQFPNGSLYQGIDSRCNEAGQFTAPICAPWLHAEYHYVGLPLSEQS
jgi:hypothetical protein